MHAFLKAALIGSLSFCLFITIGCGDKDNPAGPQAVNAVGSWAVSEAGVTVTLDVKNDKTFVMDYAGVATMSGTYTLSGNAITLTYTNCEAMGMATTCEDPAVGTISGNKMTLPVEDGTMTLTKK
jgi:hypothetical protein